jgi:hypothetical protein
VILTVPKRCTSAHGITSRRWPKVTMKNERVLRFLGIVVPILRIGTGVLVYSRLSTRSARYLRSDVQSR